MQLVLVGKTTCAEVTQQAQQCCINVDTQHSTDITTPVA